MSGVAYIPEKFTTARKDHRCMLCHQPIYAGGPYVSERLGPHNSDNDIFFTYRAHIDCDRFYRNHVPRHIKDEGLPTAANEWDELLDLYGPSEEGA